MDDPTFSWRLGMAGIIAIFCAVMCAFSLVTVLRHQRRLAAMHAQVDRVGRRDLMMADTWPTLPVVRPSYHFDHSDTSEATISYCPQCALESVAAVDYRTDDGFYPAPRGVPSFCLEHAATWSMRAAEENA